jgi:6-phosphogluconolactonase (cycloisomerase 2 family)
MFAMGVHTGQASPGAVYTMSNSTEGNEVLIFNRSADGSLSPAGSVATGGLGSGGGLGNQGGLVLSENGKWLYAVNAGSHDISVLLVHHRGLKLVDRIESGGLMPISITVHQNLLYVLNAGGAEGDADNVTGFYQRRNGSLWPLPGSTRSLSDDNTGPAQVEFSPDGSVLVVSEKATSSIDTYVVGRYGYLHDQKVFASPTPTPFGFAFGKRGQMFVSEADGGAEDASAVSSYQVWRNGELELISESVPTTETAACWVVVTRNGRFAYASNTGSGSITGYRIPPNGEIKLLDDDGVTGETGEGSSPIDMALSKNSRYLYCLNAGNGTISAFRVTGHGALQALSVTEGLPEGASGLAAR